MVEELLNEIVYCLIDLVENVTEAVIRLGKWLSDRV